MDHITNQRNAKLMKKVSVEKVMLDIAKEDVALKKDFFAEMKNSDKEQCDQLRVLNETTLNLTKSINEGVRLFGQPTPPAIVQNRQFVPPYPTHLIPWSKCWSNPPNKWHEPAWKHIQFPQIGTMQVLKY